MKIFRFYITRTPKSLLFKDQSTKAKFFYLKSMVDYLESRVEKLESKDN
jgi:hypothetical protein